VKTASKTKSKPAKTVSKAKAIPIPGQIAEMAKEALAVWKVSKRLEWLWRHEQILDPKRIRAAFADHIMLKLWKEEVKAAGMRTIDALGYQKV
jgi:hypothetical protein